MSLKLQGSLTRPGFSLEFALDLPATGFTAVCGPSGAGKSTLLRCVAGLEPRFSGTVRVGPEVWQDQHRTLPTHRRPLGYVFQDGGLFNHLDVAGNLRFGFNRTAPDRRRTGWDEAVQILDLQRLLPRAVRGLSGGERQRVALGRALLRSPDLLLLDEPLAALDRPARRGIFPFLERIRDELAVPALYVTHSLDEAARLADRLVLVEAGRIVRHGDLTDLLAAPDLGSVGDEEAGAVLATVVGHIDGTDHLARLDFDGGSLLVADQGLRPGHAVRVRIHARDVSLAVEAPIGTSILNVMPGLIDRLWPAAPGRVAVRVQIGGAVLLAAITARSAQTLGLAPGVRVWVQVKSVALL